MILTCCMLEPEARDFAAGTDIVDDDRPGEEGREPYCNAQDLAASFEYAPVDLERSVGGHLRGLL